MPSSVDNHPFPEKNRPQYGESEKDLLFKIAALLNGGTEAPAESCVSALVAPPPNADYMGLTYDGDDNVETITYKTGGSSGTLLKTVTLAYSGDNVISVTVS